ncbi:MAG: hypothetical protein AB7N73_10090 [Gemmatimonadales bacterium]
MTRIVAASLGTAVWRAGLADPHLHWKRGRSAWELAVSWEGVRTTERGMPPEVAAAFDRNEQLADPRLLLGIVEHRVELDTAKTPSQNDLWCMIRTASGLASVAVEGKAGEDFDRPLSLWMGRESATKRARLEFLVETLGAAWPPASDLRYQLFHRTASAILEARRWDVPNAVMLVQSFGESTTSWSDYSAFATYLGLHASRGEISGPVPVGKTSLFLGWVDSAPANDSAAARAI